jgi:CRP-like cAMP-binding protein
MSNEASHAGDPRQNRLLAALPDIEWRRVLSHLEPVELSHGEMILWESDSPLTHAYFPTTSIISLLYASADGVSTEIATVGNEGLVGISLFMGGTVARSRWVAQRGGHAYRLGAAILRAEFSRGATMQKLLLQYTQARLTLIGQTAVCNRRHSIDQQLCRWLLLTLDRHAPEVVTMTHERLANTLGVRREGITDAARKLQAAGLIKYNRGRIAVIDRAGVEAFCCECYGVVRRAFDLLPAARASPPQVMSPSSAASKNHTTHTAVPAAPNPTLPV